MKKVYLGKDESGSEFYRIEPDTIWEHIQYFFAEGGIYKIILFLLTVYWIAMAVRFFTIVAKIQ